MGYYLIEGQQLRKEDGTEYYHGGLDVMMFKKIVYNHDFTKAVVQSLQSEQVDLTRVREISEAEFNNTMISFADEKAQIEASRPKQESIEERLIKLEGLLADVISMQLGV